MLGTVENKAGLLFKGNNFKVVKKVINSGKMEMFLNGEEKHILVPGDILHFDGKNFISGNALEDSEINITLILK